MRVNLSGSLWDWYLKFFHKGNTVSTGNSIVHPSNTTSSAFDTVSISREARFSQIQKRVASGKPLIGISFDEFCKEYYFNALNTSPRGGMYEAREAYNQAVKGMSAMAADSDLQKAVQQQAERWANGENLSDEEKQVLQSDPEQYVAASAKRSFLVKSEQIRRVLADFGIALDENEKVQISLYGGKFSVTGDFSKEKRTAIENALNSLPKTVKNSFMALYSNEQVSSYIKNVPKSKRYLSAAVGESEYLLEHYSVGTIRLEDLFIDPSGKIQGLPTELEKYFEGITSDKNAPIETDNLAERNAIMTKRVQKEAIEAAVKAVQEWGYGNLPRYSFDFEFSGGTLTAVDTYLAIQ